MRSSTRLSTVPAVLLLALGAACGSGGTDADEPPTPATSTSGQAEAEAETEPTAAPASDLEGSWTATISQKDARKTLREAGFDDATIQELFRPEEWPENPLTFTLKVVGHTMSLFLTDTGEEYTQVTFAVDGDLLTDQPYESTTWRYRINGDKLRLEVLTANPPDEPYIREWFTSVPWTRVQ